MRYLVDTDYLIDASGNNRRGVETLKRLKRFHSGSASSPMEKSLVLCPAKYDVKMSIEERRAHGEGSDHDQD